VRESSEGLGRAQTCRAKRFLVGLPKKKALGLREGSPGVRWRPEAEMLLLDGGAQGYHAGRSKQTGVENWAAGLRENRRHRGDVGST